MTYGSKQDRNMLGIESSDRRERIDRSLLKIFDLVNILHHLPLFTTEDSRSKEFFVENTITIFPGSMPGQGWLIL